MNLFEVEERLKKVEESVDGLRVYIVLLDEKIQSFKDAAKNHEDGKETGSAENPMVEKKKWISLPIAAEKIGVSHYTVANFYRNGGLQSKKINNRIYVSLDDVEKYMDLMGSYYTPSEAMEKLGGIPSVKLANLSANGCIKKIKDPMRPKRYLYEKASVERWVRFHDENELIG